MGTGETKTLFVADDEPGFRALVRNVAEKIGWDVVECENGIELTEAVQKYPRPSLVILDLMMPKMDGFETLAWLSEKGIDIPVCVVSGGLLEGSRIYSKLSSGTQPQIKKMMRKPVRLDSLRQVLDFVDF